MCAERNSRPESECRELGSELESRSKEVSSATWPHHDVRSGVSDVRSIKSEPVRFSRRMRCRLRTVGL